MQAVNFSDYAAGQLAPAFQTLTVPHRGFGTRRAFTTAAARPSNKSWNVTLKQFDCSFLRAGYWAVAAIGGVVRGPLRIHDVAPALGGD